MAERYQPKSRRPIAALFRRTADVATDICVRTKIHPDAISYSSVVVSGLGGICLLYGAARPWLLALGPLLFFARLWLNMLDGMVALAAGLASRRGEILNDLPDRFSDVIVFGCVAHSGLCRPWLGYWAAIAALLTAYVGTLSQAVGGRRQFGGWMSKPWRMVALAIGIWSVFFGIKTGRFGPIEWACFVVVAGCVQTVAVRLRKALRELEPGV